MLYYPLPMPARTNDLMSVQLGVRFSRKARQPLISPSGLKNQPSFSR